MRKATFSLTMAVTALLLAVGFMGWQLGAAPLPSRPDRPAQADRTLSPYFFVQSDDPHTDALPLKSSRAEVNIAGVVAGVKITQIYKNEGKKTLEAIYIFPGSTRAAVHAMRMTVGERVVDAKIMERQQARQTYEQARQEGKTTSLLEQQRPNVFQMNVANILPGDEVKVELDYVELMVPQDQMYDFVLPTVVGPRYSNQPEAGAPATEKWVKNPYLHQGEAPPYTYGLSLTINTPLPLSELGSPSHEVDVAYTGKQSAKVTLKDEKTAANRDFVLRYSLAGGKIQSGLLLYPGQEENFFLMMMEPPARVKADAVTPREYLFIVDVSGSMHGFPLDTAKALMSQIIKGLRPQDFINVLLFESGNAVLSESGSLPANEADKKKALEFIAARPGGGGTEILPAFKRALALPRTPKTSRIVVVATDGYVHVEPQLFDMIRQNLGQANLFPFGVGTAVNRHLIEGMARAGQGEPFVILNASEAGAAAARFRQYIQNPVLTQVKAAFDGFEAYDQEPQQWPDLFAQRPLVMLGKYRGAPGGTIKVTGQTAKGPFAQEIKVDQTQASPDNRALRLLWARQRLMRLSDHEGLEQGQARVKEITDLGLKYSLMTAYTSFVAVDTVKRADGQVVTVQQPLPLPQGVSDLAVGGGRHGVKAKAMPSFGRGGFMAALTPDAKGGGAMPASPAAKPDVAMEPGFTPAAPGGAAPEASSSLSLKIIRIDGHLPAEEARQVLEAKLTEMEACCQAAAAQGVSLPKDITLTFTIGADGRVAGKVLPKPPLGNGQFTGCLSRLIQGLTFANPGKQPGKVMVQLILGTS